MIKYFILRFVVFIEIAAISLLFSTNEGWPLIKIFSSNGRFLAFLFGGIVVFTFLFFFLVIFILTIRLFNAEYRDNHSIKVVLKDPLEQFGICVNYIYDSEKHQTLFIGVTILMLVSVHIPFFTQYKTFSISDSTTISYLDEYFPASHNIENSEFNLVIERGSKAESMLDRIFTKTNGKTIFKAYYFTDPTEIIKNYHYYFTNSAAIIKNYHYYECDNIRGCYETDEIFSLKDWLHNYFNALFDSLIRSIFYGIIPYIIGVIIINRKSIDELYRE